MSLLTAAKKAAENLAPPPPPQNVPSINDIVSKGQDVAGQVVGAVTDTMTHVLTTAENIAPEKIQQVTQLLDSLRKTTTGMVADLGANVRTQLDRMDELSIEPEKLVTALAKGMAVAEGLVSKNKGSDLFVSDGKIVAEFYVKLPPPGNATGAFARIELNLKSKQYLKLIGAPDEEGLALPTAFKQTAASDISGAPAQTPPSS